MSLSFHLYGDLLLKGAIMAETTQKETSRYNGIPKQVSRKDFNKYILPHLRFDTPLVRGKSTTDQLGLFDNSVSQ